MSRFTRVPEDWDAEPEGHTGVYEGEDTAVWYDGDGDQHVEVTSDEPYHERED